jgi:two-component system, LuxR family, sensor kinase FixL
MVAAPSAIIKTLNPTNGTASSADGMVRRLGARYLFVLVAVALLIVIDQAAIQPLLIRLDTYAPVINLSGRQRMLSQRLTKAALNIERSKADQTTTSSKNELRLTLKQWSKAHTILREGDESRGIQRITSPEIQDQWEILTPHFVVMAAAAQELLVSSANGQLNESSHRAVEAILEHEALFLASMDKIVKLMEGEAAREVRQLRTLALAIAGTIVGLLVGLGWFVVRPATRTIRRQVDHLETQVAERTSDLSSALKSLRDEIAEREEVESKNQRLSAQLAHADRVESIGYLAVGLAHELNHPLGTITNYAEACDVLLNRGDQQTQYKKLSQFVSHIRDASLRAGKIVKRMRNFVQSNTTETADIDIRILIEEIIELCQTEITGHQAQLSTKLGNDAIFVSVDAIQIQQVLVNLLKNALDAMADIPIHERKLVICVTHSVDQVRIDVADNGTGFKFGDPELAFEPFNSEKVNGLGVGLSICRAIIEAHQGMIWAESPPDQGAMVSFTLPIVSPHASHPALQSDSLRS